MNYDVGSDIVYDFFNIRDDAITFEEGDDISDTTKIYSVVRNCEQTKEMFKNKIIKIKNMVYDERVAVIDVATSGGDEFEMNTVIFENSSYLSNCSFVKPNDAVLFENDKLKDFINKITSVRNQNIIILNNGTECLAFVSVHGMMIYKKLGAIIPASCPNLIFTSDYAEKIKWVYQHGDYITFYDENDRVIKFNNFVSSAGYNVLFDRLEIEGKSLKMKRNDFVGKLCNVNFITSDDKAEFKMKFLKSKMKFMINKNFVVENCVIEMPTKSGDISGKTFTLSAKIIKDYVSKTESEDLILGIHKEAVFRICSDDLNFFFAELTNRSDD